MKKGKSGHNSDIRFKIVFIICWKHQYEAIFNALSSHFPVERVVLPHTWQGRTKFGKICETIANNLQHTPSLLRLFLARGTPIVCICGEHYYAALLAAKLVSLIGRDVRTYLFRFYLHELGAYEIVKVIMRWLLSTKVALFVQSPDEVDYYHSINKNAVVACSPFIPSETDDDAIPSLTEKDIRLGDYIFCGGRSNRDYDVVLRAAKALPHLSFILACGRSNRISESIPGNVRLVKDIDPLSFYSLLAKSRLVIVSLKNNIGSSGQLVVQAAMRYGKMVFYSNNPCLSQYLIDDRTGIAFQPGNHLDLQDKIEKYYNNIQKLVSMGSAAKKDIWTRFSAKQFQEKLTSHILSWLSSQSC